MSCACVRERGFEIESRQRGLKASSRQEPKILLNKSG